MAERQTVQPDLDFIREIRAAGGDTLNKCYQCATCSTVCNLSPANQPFPRKEMIWAQWGMADKLVNDPDIWACFQCNDCTIHCPREARPGDVLAAVRTFAYRNFSFPSFMGKALAKPSALPVLLAIPAIILLACIFIFAPHTETGEYVFMTSNVIDYNFFLPHSSVDALFVFGNILIFIFAAVGFLRFWKGLKRPDDEIKVGFIPAFIQVFFETLSHKRFNMCETNKPRTIGHMLLLFGFIGAMFTTGAVFVFIFIPHYLNLLGLESLHSWFNLPIDLPNPVKILGVLSGVALMLGGILLIVRRWTSRDIVGANGYADYLFLYIMTIVGLTGMLSWVTRLIGIPMLAYVNYFIHMLSVFFLLWYMPYSKFAHMIYRTLGLVYARQIGRQPR
ncbi:MAG TPA: quinone-interacting membrane-bound oxidoreductase complex subunit QmoC [candidate division Zixibacteria bacterium]|nr:quinone-interacting membrane-bound oxidoreductase complex subunit QmoC [candidate division Zixibacteria bacterium]